MRSKVARTITQERSERLALLTPDERVQLASRLGEQGVQAFMAQHGVDRVAAVAHIKATRQLGRRPSKSHAP